MDESHEDFMGEVVCSVVENNKNKKPILPTKVNRDFVPPECKKNRVSLMVGQEPHKLQTDGSIPPLDIIPKESQQIINQDNSGEESEMSDTIIHAASGKTDDTSVIKEKPEVVKKMVVKEVPIKKLPIEEPIEKKNKRLSIFSDKKKLTYLVSLYFILISLVIFLTFAILSIKDIEISPTFNSSTDNVFNNNFDNVVNSEAENNYDIDINFDIDEEFVNSICGNSS